MLRLCSISSLCLADYFTSSVIPLDQRIRDHRQVDKITMVIINSVSVKPEFRGTGEVLSLDLIIITSLFPALN